MVIFVVECDFLYTGGYWFESPSHAFFLNFLLSLFCHVIPCVYSSHVNVLYISNVSDLKMRVMLTLFAHPLRFRVGGSRRPHGDSGDRAPGCCCVHRGRGQEIGAAEAQRQTKGILPSIHQFSLNPNTYTHSLPAQLCQISSTKGCGSVLFLFCIRGEGCDVIFVIL